MEGTAYQPIENKTDESPPPSPSSPSSPSSPGYHPAPQQFNSSGPPLYNASPPLWTSQQGNNNIIHSQQPRPVIPLSLRRPVKDHYLTFSFAMTLLAVICCNWPSLLCTVPAIIFANKARDADERLDIRKAKTHGRIALALNIVAIFTYIGLVEVIIVIIATQSDSIDII